MGGVYVPLLQNDVAWDGESGGCLRVGGGPGLGAAVELPQDDTIGLGTKVRLAAISAKVVDDPLDRVTGAFAEKSQLSLSTNGGRWEGG